MKGRKPLAQRRERTTLWHGEPAWKAEPPKHLALKARVAEFWEFLRSVGLKTWNFRKSAGSTSGEQRG